MESTTVKKKEDEIVQKSEQETLTPSSIPVYLRDSDFGASLNYDDDDSFSVPKGVTKATTDVHSVQDLDNILATFRFWGLRELPLSVLKFTIANSSDEVLAVCKKYTADLPSIAAIAEVLTAPQDCRQIAIAMKKNYLGLVKYLHSIGRKLKDTSALDAIRNEQVECLQFALSVIKPSASEVFTAAVACKNPSIMRVILHFYADRPCCTRFPIAASYHKPPRSLCDVAACVGDIEYIKQAMVRGWKCSYQTAFCAAAHGHLDCLKYLFSSGVAMIYGVFIEAVQYKNFDCAVYAMQNSTFRFARIIGIDTIAAVAGAGQLGYLALMQPFVNMIVYKSIKPCLLAAQHGHLDCLTFLHEHHYRWDSTVTTAAADAGHYSCFWYAVQQGCIVSARVISLLASRGGEPSLLQLTQLKANTNLEQIAACAAEQGYSDCLRCVVENGCDKTAAVCAAAALGNQLSLLQYLHQNGFPMDQRTTHCAARRGHYDCLWYAVQQECTVDARVIGLLADRGGESLLLQIAHLSAKAQIATCAAERGYSDCLRCVVENGCDRTAAVCAAAALGNQLSLLQYLHQNGFPMDQRTTHCAARRGHFACLEYALQQFCPVGERTCEYLAERGELRLLQMTTELFTKQHVGQQHSEPRYRVRSGNGIGHKGVSLTVRQSSVTAAAQHGHLACLRYLVEQCGFAVTSSDVSSASVRHGQWECAEYLQQRGCVFTKTAARKLAQHLSSV